MPARSATRALEAGLAAPPAPAIVIAGRDGERRVTFDPPLFLAPMEGVTDPLFRELVIGIGGVGGACTEFLRVTTHATPLHVIRGHLGARRECPVGVQLMAADEEHLAETASNAERAGAAYLDLNFGCPAKVVFNKCAGSALLAHPEGIAAIVRAARRGTTLPVTAKMRAGIDDPRRLAECVVAAAEAGAALVTLHARLRRQSYAEPATWAWIAEARRALETAGHAVPLVGNGCVLRASDVLRLREETGCAGVMIGRGAVADPWIFREAQGGPAPTAAMAADFALRYAEGIEAASGPRAALAKLKQLIRWYSAGAIFAGREDDRAALLRARDIGPPRAFFKEFIENGHPGRAPGATGSIDQD